MPSPNHQIAELQPREKFDDWRRTNGGNILGGHVKVPSSILVTWGHVKNGPADAFLAAGLWFPKEKYTAAQARAWLKANGIKPLRFYEAAAQAREFDEEKADYLDPKKNPLLKTQED